MKPLYGGIDLHANNSVIVVLDEEDQIVIANDSPMTWSTSCCNSPPIVHSCKASWSSPRSTGIG